MKTVIAPIIAVIAIACQYIFGIDISAETQSVVVENVVNIVLGITVIHGIIKNHFNKKDKESV